MLKNMSNGEKRGSTIDSIGAHVEYSEEDIDKLLAEFTAEIKETEEKRREMAITLVEMIDELKEKNRN